MSGTPALIWRMLAALLVALALTGWAAATTGSGQAPSSPYRQSEPRDISGMH